MLVFTNVIGPNEMGGVPQYACFVLNQGLIDKVAGLESLLRQNDLLGVEAQHSIDWEGHHNVRLNPLTSEHQVHVFKASHGGVVLQFIVFSNIHNEELRSSWIAVEDLKEMLKSGKQYDLTDVEDSVLDLAECVKVEYDVNFTGGNYSGVGEFVYVPEDVLGSIESAFTAMTGLDGCHIIHRTSDEKFTIEGDDL